MKKKTYRVRYDRIIFTALILAALILMMTSCISSCLKQEDSTDITADDSAFSPLENELETTQTATLPSADSTAGEVLYADISKNSDSIHTGNLILVNAEYPCTFDPQEIADGTSPDVSLVTIHSLLDGKEEWHYTAADSEVCLDRQAAYAMDAWFEDFYQETENSDIRMIGGYRADAGDLDFRTGKTLTMGTYPETGSSNFYYPDGIYAWLDEHSAEYGFVVRYPEGKDELFDSTITSRRTATFRYVGIAPAVYMQEHNMCLEEFLETVRNYSIDHMMQVTCGSAQFGIYYVPADTSSPTTTFSVPSGDLGYEISGNNIDGFVIIAALNEDAVKTRRMTPNYEDLDE